MRALLLEVPEELLVDRQRKRIDRWDEVWDGVLHLGTLPGAVHQCFRADLLVALCPITDERGVELLPTIGVFRPGCGERDYRVADLAIVREQYLSDRGVEGKAELVIEVLSTGDESREKLGFYAACGIPEVLLVEPGTREFELYVLRNGSYFILKDDRGSARSSVLGVTFALVDGPKLRVTAASGFTDV